LLRRISSSAGVVLPLPANQSLGEANSWLGRLREHLPEGLRPHLVDVLEKAGGLVLFADSAAWAGRIRLALPDLSAVATGRPMVVRMAQKRNKSPG
jgi:hypothetical protein